MKKFVILLTIALIIVSCSVSEKPQFINVENVHVVRADMDSVILTADANFHNPNDISGTLASDDLMVLINDIEMAKVTSIPFKVPANKDFTIPLTVSMETKKVLEEQGGSLLGGILNTIMQKKLKVQYKGNIKYKVLGFSHSYPVDKTEEIKIKL